MKNLVSYFKEQIELFDSQQKCGFCWHFKAPLSEAGLNTSVPDKEHECCVAMILTYYKVVPSFRTPTTGLTTTDTRDHIFTAYVVKPQADGLGRNVFNEEPGHSTADSIWESVLEPILNCIGNGNELDFCENYSQFKLVKWDQDTVVNKADANYAGWRITGAIRETL